MKFDNELESIVDTSLSFDYYLDQLFFIKLSFESHLTGSHYLLNYVEQAIKNNYNIYRLSPTADIYPEIAKKYRKSIQIVEHAIRHAIERSWKNMDENIKHIVFPVLTETRPTNSEALYAIYEYVKAYYPLQDDNYRLIEINGEKRVMSSKWVYYQINFFLQRMLENKFKIGSKYGINKLHILSDAIMYRMQLLELNDDDYRNMIKYLNEKYGLYDGFLLTREGTIELSETVNLLFKMCKRIHNLQEDYPSPKNKKYVKTYLNILSNEANELL